MPCITVDLREHMYKGGHLRRIASCSKSISAKINYLIERNKTRTYLRHARNDYYDTVISDSANTPTSFWTN